MEAIRIVVVDDHPVVRAGIIAALKRESDLQVVGQAQNGEEAIQLAKDLRPDVMLMDLRMPGIDGTEAMKAIRLRYPAIKFVVLTTYDSDEYLFKGTQAGAMAYLMKDCTVEELLEAIRRVHEGHSLIKMMPNSRRNPEELRWGSPVLDEEKALSQREIEILRLAAQGMSGKRIARHLSISESTVKAHMSNVFRKLKVKNRPEAVAEALRRRILQI